MLQSPLEMAKNVLENELLLKLNQTIDSFKAKYVTFFYFPAASQVTKESSAHNFSHQVGFIVKEASLAECFLKNDWSREENKMDIPCLHSVPITKVVFNKSGGPLVDFNKTYEKLYYKKACKQAHENYKTEALAAILSPAPFFPMEAFDYSAFPDPTKFSISRYSSIYILGKNDVPQPKLQWCISPTVVKNLAKNLNFEDIYQKYLDEYWNENYMTYLKHLRLSFLHAVLSQVKEGSLSLEGAQIAQGIFERNQSISGHFLGFARPNYAKWKFWLDDLLATPQKYAVYSYDMVCFTNSKHEHVLLYIQGNSSPIHEFTNLNNLYIWLVNQTKSKIKRQVIQSHFFMSDWQNITSLFNFFYAEGVNDILYAMSQTELNASTLNDYFVLSAPISNDQVLFDKLTKNVMEKSKGDIPYMVTSNRDRFKEQILYVVHTFSTFILPFALICPECVIFDVIFFTNSAFEIGVGMDDLIHHKAAFVNRLYFGILNAVPTFPSVLRFSEVTHSKLKPIIDLLLDGNNYNELTTYEPKLSILKESDVSRKSETFSSDYYVDINKPNVGGKLEEKFFSLEEQAMERGQKIIILDKEKFLVDVSQQPTSFLYTFKIKEGRINDIQRTGNQVYYNNNIGKWEKIGLLGGGKDISLIPFKKRNYNEVNAEKEKLAKETNSESSISTPFIPFKKRKYDEAQAPEKDKIITETSSKATTSISSFIPYKKRKYHEAQVLVQEKLADDTTNRASISAHSVTQKPLYLREEKITDKINNIPSTSALSLPQKLNDQRNTDDALISLYKEKSSRQTFSPEGILVEEGGAIKNNEYNFANMHKFSDGTVLIENLKGELRQVIFDNIRAAWRYFESKDFISSIALTTEGQWVELSETIPIIIPEKLFINLFPSIPQVLGPSTDILEYYLKLNGNKFRLNGIIFQRGKFNVFYQKEFKTVIYDSKESMWKIPGSSKHLGYTLDKEWVELDDKALKTPNQFITFDQLIPHTPFIELEEKSKVIPMRFNYVIMENTPLDIGNIIKNHQKAYEYINDESIAKETFIYIYKEETELMKLEEITSGYPGIKVVNLMELSSFKEFYSVVLKSLLKKNYDMASLLARLKVSTFIDGLFLGVNCKIPSNIFEIVLKANKDGILLFPPIFNKELNDYIYTSEIFASTKTTREGPSRLLNSCLNNLNKNIYTHHDELFSRSVAESFMNYKEYLKYYKFITKSFGAGNFIKLSNKEFDEKVKEYFGSLRATGLIKKRLQYFSFQDSSFFPSLARDLESRQLMETFNVWIVKVDEKEYIIYPTNYNVRELYLYRSFKGNIVELKHSDLYAVFDQQMNIRVVQKKLSEIKDLDDFNKYIPSYPVEVPIDNVNIFISTVNPGFDCQIKINDKNLKIIYDIKSRNWRRYFWQRGILNIEAPISKEELLLNNAFQKGGAIVGGHKFKKLFVPTLPKIFTQRDQLKHVPKILVFLIQDTKMIENFLTWYKTAKNTITNCKAILYHDIGNEIEAYRHELNGPAFKLVTVKDLRQGQFFKNYLESELGKYYEVAKKVNTEAAFHLGKHGIMYETGGIFMDFRKKLTTSYSLRKAFFVDDNNLLLELPYKERSPLNEELQFTDYIFACAAKNNLLEKLNNRILNTLTKNDGFFGELLAQSHLKETLFPLEDIMGKSAFHKNILENSIPMRLIMNYLSEEDLTIIYNKDFEEIRNLLFLLPRTFKSKKKLI
jgi:hypothetical protein